MSEINAPKIRTVEAVQYIRPLNGGTKPDLMEADDGNFYIVKAPNNPQGGNTLIAELFGYVALSYLDVIVPKIAKVRVTDKFLARNSHYLAQEKKGWYPEAGLHCGSRFPGNPNTDNVYGDIPGKLISDENVEAFLTAFAFDIWGGNEDTRQAVYTRDQKGGRNKFITHMIDNGLLFKSLEDKIETPLDPGVHRKALYCTLFHGSVIKKLEAQLKQTTDKPLGGYLPLPMERFEPTLSLIQSFPPDLIKQTFDQVPAEWMRDKLKTREDLDNLRERLVERRGDVQVLLEASLKTQRKILSLREAQFINAQGQLKADGLVRTDPAP